MKLGPPETEGRRLRASGMAWAGHLLTWLLWGYLLELWAGGHAAGPSHPRLRLAHKGRSPFQTLPLSQKGNK